MKREKKKVTYYIEIYKNRTNNCGYAWNNTDLTSLVLKKDRIPHMYTWAEE